VGFCVSLHPLSVAEHKTISFPTHAGSVYTICVLFLSPGGMLSLSIHWVVDKTTSFPNPCLHSHLHFISLHFIVFIPTSNQYTITPLQNLGIPLNKLHRLATALHCHAKNSLKNIKNKTQNWNPTTKLDSTTTTVIIGDLEGGSLVERLALGGLGARWIAWLTSNPPDPQ
jgi:hypothetical protein